MSSAEIDHDDAQRLGHLLWEVAARNSLLREASLARVGLTAAAVGMLDSIGGDPGVSIAELSRRLPVTPQAVSQVVGRLERLGYVERRKPEHGRGVSLYITESGEAAHRAADERRIAQENELAEALGEERYGKLKSLLKEARQVVKSMEGG